MKWAGQEGRIDIAVSFKNKKVINVSAKLKPAIAFHKICN